MDNHTPEQRRKNMQAIKSLDTHRYSATVTLENPCGV